MRRKAGSCGGTFSPDNISKMHGTHSMKFGAYWEYQQGTGTYAYAAPASAVLFSPEIVQYFNSQVPAPFQIADSVFVQQHQRHLAASGGRI